MRGPSRDWRSWTKRGVRRTEVSPCPLGALISGEFILVHQAGLRKRRRGTQKKLNRAADAQLAHTSLESGALDVEEDGGTFGPGDAPLRLLQGAKDVLAFGFFEGGD